ncbi:hypothetical protein F4779DRAFT_599458 [Xylariaceae sp. FL0662B]|nr:hypothetical protein F4779DRAFT_599458 [Xylariaceae sp. FL0662B]
MSDDRMDYEGGESSVQSRGGPPNGERGTGSNSGSPSADTFRVHNLNRSLDEVIEESQKGQVVLRERLQLPFHFVEKGEAKKMFNRAGHLTALINKEDPLLGNTVETSKHWWRGQIQHEHAEEFFQGFRDDMRLKPGEQVMVTAATMSNPALKAQAKMDLNLQRAIFKKRAAKASEATAGAPVRPSRQGDSSATPYKRPSKRGNQKNAAEMDADMEDYFRRGTEQAEAKESEARMQQQLREEPAEDYS